jgi:uncharacterized protein DUF7003
VERGPILDQFDAAADEAVFVDLENGYYYPIDSRLHACCDATRWALVVELVGYMPRHGAVTDVLHVFGDCLTFGEPGFGNDDLLDRIENVEAAVREYTLPVALRVGDVEIGLSGGRSAESRVT